MEGSDARGPLFAFRFLRGVIPPTCRMHTLPADVKAFLLLFVNAVIFKALVTLGVVTDLLSGAVALAAFLLFQRWVASGRPCTAAPRLDGKTVVVTGANNGIGLQTALALAKLGGRVILACRSSPKAQKAMKRIQREAPDAKLLFLQLDLADLDSVRRAADELSRVSGGKIDILINNAGVLDVSGPGKPRLPNGHEYHIGQNFLGPVLLTQLLLPAVKAAHGRIVNLASMFHWQVQPIYARRGSPTPVTDLVQHLEDGGKFGRFFPYSLSKTAVIMWTRWLAAQVEGTGVLAVSLHPGSVPTGIFKAWFYHVFCPIFGPVLFFKTVREGAQTSLHCALAPDIVSGSFYNDSERRDDTVIPMAYSQGDAEALMAWALRQVGLPAVPPKQEARKTMFRGA